MGGTSYNKDNGTGIGVSSAIKLVHKYNGTFDIVSKVGQGTAVNITLPTTVPPKWFQQHLALHAGQTVVILDDDESIHTIWQSRFSAYCNQLTLLHFRQIDEFITYCKQDIHSETLFLVDYELLGEKQTGLDLIEKLDLKQAILVTSRYEDIDIQARVEKLGLTMIPKNHSPSIPIKFNE